jgi:hypothetical protein
MKHLSLTHFFTRPLILCLLVGAPLTASAQAGNMTGPPKVLVIEREYLKPGKGGTTHERSESAFVRAMMAAKSTNHYFALDSLSGPSRSLFFFNYSSFADWEKADKDVQKNATLSAALDRAYLADGELLSEYDQNAFMLRDDLSFNTGNLLGKRYMEITQFVVKPGHTQDFEAGAKLYLETNKKANLDTNWATFQLMYGANTGDVFIFITTLKSLAESDKEMGLNEQFVKAMGESNMKKLNELSAASIESQMTNLFEINPKNSYPPDEWLKAEPDFWKPKPAAPAKKPDTAPTK